MVYAIYMVYTFSLIHTLYLGYIFDHIKNFYMIEKPIKLVQKRAQVKT